MRSEIKPSLGSLGKPSGRVQRASVKPLIKWSKQDLLLQDTQACGKTTPKSKGIINTIVHIVHNAEKKA